MAKQALTKEQERLAKLWDAYEAQEKEFDAALKKISVLESKLKEKEQVNETLRKVIEARDNELRDLEIKVANLGQAMGRAEPRIEELSKMHKDEKNRYAKLFAITEELEEELSVARKEIEARDEWYRQNVSLLGNLARAIDDRTVLIQSAANVREARVEDISSLKPDEPAATPPTPAVDDPVTDTAVKFEKPAEEEEVKFAQVPKGDLNAILAKVPGMDDDRTGALKDAGFDSVEKIKEATTRELAAIDGISPTLARKIKTEVIANTE